MKNPAINSIKCIKEIPLDQDKKVLSILNLGKVIVLPVKKTLFQDMLKTVSLDRLHWAELL